MLTLRGKRRTFLVQTVFVATFICKLATGQNISTPEDVIRRIVTTGTSEGHDQKVIGNMGDSAAVALTRIIGERSLTDSETEMAAYVLISAFADVRVVANPADGQPRTALFVLHCLASSTKNQHAQQAISDARTKIMSAVSEAAARRQQNPQIKGKGKQD